MARFSKFEIWHTQDSDPDLINVTETSRVLLSASRDDVTHTRDVIDLDTETKRRIATSNLLFDQCCMVWA